MMVSVFKRRPDRTPSLLSSLFTVCLLVIAVFLVSGSANAQSQRQVLEDIEQGEKTARQVEEQMGLYDSPVAREYVALVGQRLVDQLENNPYPFRFDIVDQWTPNAFALPGGRIYVSRGMLALLNSEDELAGVLGHEISHVIRRHSARRSNRGLLAGVLMVPGAVVGTVVSSDLGRLINTPIATIGQVTLASYSRGQETEADRMGARLAAAAGYNPASLADILSRMEGVVEALTGNETEKSFFDSHPTTPKRLQTVSRETAKIDWTARAGIAPADEVTSRFEGVHIGQNPEAGIFRENRYLNPVFNFTLEFPGGWKTVNNPTVVAGMSAEEDALAALSILGKAVDPASLGQVFSDRLYSEYGMRATEARSVNVSGAPGYVIKLTEGSGEDASHLYYLWVAMGGKTFQLIAAGSDRHFDTLRNIALSLRPLRKEEREAITEIRLHVVEAREGESLESLGQRSENHLKTNITALINGLPANTVLAEGKRVKIARESRFGSYH